MPTQRPAVRGRTPLAKAARVLLLALLGTLGFVVLAIVGVLVWLHTASGSRTVAELAVHEAKGAIEGRLAVHGIELRGFIGVCADGVDLRDPEGHPVLRAERACVHLQPLALRAHRLVFDRIELTRPWIDSANVTGPDGKPTTTLLRALAARTPKPKTQAQSGPFAWTIDLRALRIEDGALTLRPGLDKEPSVALEHLSLGDAHALYRSEAAAAALELGAQLEQPGRARVALTLDAQLEGTPASGKTTLRTLRLRLGDSGLDAQGDFDLATRAGALQVRALRLVPRDLAIFAPGRLDGEVRGEADARSDGHRAEVDLRLEGGGGKLHLHATSTLASAPEWALRFNLDQMDVGALTAKAPHGQVTASADLRGKGLPKFDAHGVNGDLEGKVHLGPAQLERIGPLHADVDARIEGRNALIRAFSATALGLTLKAAGRAAWEDVALDLELIAPDLAHVGRAVGALTRKPSVPASGALHLVAHATGRPTAPDAQVHLRAPRLRWGPTLLADGLAVDGTLHGKLSAPRGALTIAARRLAAAGLDLGAPRVAASLDYPVAHLRIDAGVKGGAVQVAGDATIDADRDGVELANLRLAYPENQFRLAEPVDLHFRDAIIVEPLELRSDHGVIRVSGQLDAKRMDAAVVVERLDLAHLPQFALPKDLALRGVVDLNAVAEGARTAPEFDLRVDARGVNARRIGTLFADAHAHAHLHGGRLKTDGWAKTSSGAAVSFDGDVPAMSPARLPSTSPLRFEATVSAPDLALVANQLELSSAQRNRLAGAVEARVVASGTLQQPRATVSLNLQRLSVQRVQNVDLQSGLLLERGRASLDGRVALQGVPTLVFTGDAPFDLVRAVRDPAYLRAAAERPVNAQVAVSRLDLGRLAQQGIVSEGTAGLVSLALRASGTMSNPQLQLEVTGDGVTAGNVRGVSFEGNVGVTDRVKLALDAQAKGVPVLRLSGGAQLSGAELIRLARQHAQLDAIGPLLDRSLALTLEIPGLPIQRASELAGRKGATDGLLTGRIALSGTAARPRLVGRLAVSDLVEQSRRLGKADVYVEANEAGAMLHLGVDPPGQGGHLLGHAQLKAPLGARALLTDGIAVLQDGTLIGDLKATGLDLSFLSGVTPTLRRAQGVLDANVQLAGVVSKPELTGEAHLHRGLFDLVGQGVFEDVGLDAKFTPRQAVVDRLTGTTGNGTFSAVLVAAERAGATPDDPSRLEFSGEVHLGDAESVRDRKTPDGKPLTAAAVPVRQAGEQRADVSGELDLFGDYTESVLTVNAKIPDAKVRIQQLPSKKLPALKPPPDIVLIHPGEKPHPPGVEPADAEAEAKARAAATFRLHAQLDLQHLYVQAADFEFPVQSQMNFDWSAHDPDHPTADGTIHVPQGSFSALGRRFTINGATITETGGDIADPDLDVKAVFDNPKAVVTIAVTGSAKDPNLQMSSNPPMDQDAIAFFLATGRIQGQATQSGGGVDLSGAATSVLGGVLFGQLRKELADVLPVDVLTIEAGDKGVSQASVGKYIGDKVFIGYRQRLTPAPNENTSEGRVEYEISRSLTTEATVGDKNSDVSLDWTRNF